MSDARPVMGRREAGDKLRAELGITAEWAKGKRGTTGVAICTGAEFYALRQALRLSLPQMAAQLGCSKGTLNYWSGHKPDETIHGKRAIADRVRPMLVRARELGLLVVTPAERAMLEKKPGRSAACGRRRQPSKPRWRCTQCGKGFRRKELEEDPGTGDLVHRLPDGGAERGMCGRVVPAARGEKPAKRP